MEATQNDLSFDKVRLDYQTLIKTAEIAYGKCMDNVARYLDDLRQYPNDNYKLTADWLHRETGYLLVVANTLHTLKGGITRSEVEIVNKPSCGCVEETEENPL